MVIISNGVLTAEINEKGAELKRLTYMGSDRIYRGDTPYWASSSPVLFPICSGLKGDGYNYNGKRFSMGKHGFARFQIFEVETAESDRATFVLRDNAETKEQYPFSFELRVSYKLDGNKLKVGYEVKNRSEEKMYFSIGAHEGYYCPEGIENYEVLLPEKETLYSSVLVGPILGRDKIKVIENSNVIPLKYSDYQVDALVFKDIKAREVVLKNKGNGNEIKVSFGGFPYLLLWTKPNAPYICIEPWCGISDSVDSDGDITKKEGIETVEPNKTFLREHVIEIIK